MRPEEVVEAALNVHRYKYQSITCKAGDWKYNGSNDFDEHQAKVICKALRKLGYLS